MEAVFVLALGGVARDSAGWCFARVDGGGVGVDVGDGPVVVEVVVDWGGVEDLDHEFVGAGRYVRDV